MSSTTGLNECVNKDECVKIKEKEEKEEYSKGNISIGVVFIIAVSSVHSGIYLAWFTYCRSCHAETDREYVTRTTESSEDVLDLLAIGYERIQKDEYVCLKNKTCPCKQ